LNEASNAQIPAPLETRLLRGALLDGDAAIEAYRAWHAEVDFDALDGGSQRLLPLLAANLARLGYEDDFTPQLHGHRRQALAMNAHRIGAVRPALRALDAAGVETMVLKGAALVASGLSELGLRPIGDVDVLVRPADRNAAIDVLLADGWEVETYPAWYIKRVFWRTVPAWVLRKGLVELDLHWGALHLVRDPVAERPLWEHATTGSLGGEPVLVPSVEDQAMQTWLHAAEWCGLPPLRWVADAAAILGACGDRFDWDRVVASAVDQRVVLQTRSALDYLADELDQPVPREVRRRLHAERVPLLERREHAARAVRPAERGRLDAAVVELQDHRRQDVDLLARPLLAGLRDLRGSRRRPDAPNGERHDLRDGPLILGRDADPLDSPLYGWSFPEDGGRWSDGREAALAVVVEPGATAELALDLSAFVGRGDHEQRVTIAADGGTPTVLRFGADDLDLKPREVRIAVPPTTDGNAVLTFAVRAPRSPAEVGLSADERKLGVLLRSVRLVPDAAAAV
jgi:hypothetical protein